MRTVWSGPLLLVAVLGMIGQGVLLAGVGSSALSMHGVAPYLFLGLVLILVLAVVWPGRRPESEGAKPRSWLDVRSMVVLLALALQAGGLLVRISAPEDGSADRIGPHAVREVLDRASSALDDLSHRLDLMPPQVTRQFSLNASPTMTLFERAAVLQAQWPVDTGADFPLNIVVWSGSERLAWTADAEPLAAVSDSLINSRSDQGLRLLERGRGAWVLRDWISVSSDLQVELQVSLPADVLQNMTPGVALSVVTAARADQLQGIHFDRGQRVLLAGRESAKVVWIQAEPGRSKESQARDQDRTLFLLAVAWVVMLGMMLGKVPLRRPRVLLPALVSVWAARAVLARLDIFSRLSGMISGLEYPASPHSWFSLLDPAYFATPVLGGWLASTADALLTAILVLGTLVALWRMTFAGSRSDQRTKWRPGNGGGPVTALVFGLAVALLLVAMARVADLIAANANARLIGTGVPLASLSFWALHLVLMIGSLCFVLVLGLVLLGIPWPGKSAGKGNPAVMMIPPIVCLLGILAVGGVDRGDRILAMVLAVAFWLGIPVLAGGQRFWRRLGLPALLMLVVVWNHAVLRNLDAKAERRWLESKATAMTTTDVGWNRFLLGSILDDMQDAESHLERVEPATDIWRDEWAWHLWEQSALEDLGGPCLVELLDGQGREESLIARGFLRDFAYEVSRRSLLTGRDGQSLAARDTTTFQTELRSYSGGEELVMLGEIPRRASPGWIHVEIPLRSWRISTLQAFLSPVAPAGDDQYQPRVEIGHPVLLVRGDDTGWLQATDNDFPDPSSQAAITALKSEPALWREVSAGGRRWLCLWRPLPPEAARSRGEGFLIGLQINGPTWVLLDLSRLMLLNLVFLFLGQGLYSWRRWAFPRRATGAGRRLWRPGFQESFLGGYLLLGLFLLLVVGMSVDRVGYTSVRKEARTQTRQGLSLAVEQLRSLLVEQAQSLAGSEYIADLLLGQLSGHRPVGPTEFRQAMVFDGDGNLLLDETLSNLSPDQASALLKAGRSAPLVVIAGGPDLFVGTVIPIDLTDVLKVAGEAANGRRGTRAADGFFLYRQRWDPDLLVGLADLVRGDATLILEGQPVLASHPEEFFSGHEGQLAAPGMMADLIAHPTSPGTFAATDRPFAFTGAMPLPAFIRHGDGPWVRTGLPAVLALSFPDREREFVAQRTDTVLFLTGLANLILLTALALAGLLAWNIFRPLRVLADATRSLAAGDYQAPLPEPGSDEVGELAAAFGSMRSELHTARERLAAREQFLTTVLDRVPVGVGVVDGEGNLVVLNPAGREILSAFAPDDASTEALNRLRANLVDESGTTGRGEIRSVAGARTVRGAVAPLDLPGGRTDTMVVFEDLTDFLANKKLALSAELTRQVAHEIKNPLTPIQLSAQLLGQAWQDQHRDLDRIVPETVARILDQVALLRRIATEFSLLGRPDQMVTSPVDLLALVHRVAADYGAAADAARTPGAGALVVHVAPGFVPAVQANAEALQKILGNLMQNTLDAAQPDEPPKIDVSWQVDARTVTLQWRDYGVGIAEDVAEHLFDPYFSTKTRGTGLGLAICHNLADRMGGSMALSNHPTGPGAVAMLTLPRAEDPDQDERDGGA